MCAKAHVATWLHSIGKFSPIRSFHFWLILVGQAGRSKNVRRHIKLILCCYCLIINPHTKFHLNRTKNTEVRNFHFWSILVGRAGRSKNGRRHIKLIPCCFCLIISPHTKFHPNRTKNTKLEIFTFGQFWLVGLVGRKMVVGISNLFFFIFEFLVGWLVGPVCMSEIGNQIVIQSRMS